MPLPASHVILVLFRKYSSLGNLCKFSVQGVPCAVGHCGRPADLATCFRALRIPPGPDKCSSSRKPGMGSLQDQPLRSGLSRLKDHLQHSPFLTRELLARISAGQNLCLSLQSRHFQPEVSGSLGICSVIKGWGGNSLPNSTQASWIKPPWHLSACIKTFGSHADEQGHMGLEKAKHGGPAPSWRHLSPPTPHTSSQLPPRQQARGSSWPCPSHIPRSCCPPATSTSHWCAELHQWESCQGSPVHSKKQEWSMCHLCKQPGAPQCRKNTRVKPPGEEGTTCPAPQPCRREWQEPCTL